MKEKAMARLYQGANLPETYVEKTMKELEDAEVKIEGYEVDGMITAAKQMRLKGKLPYYLAIAIASWFATLPIESEENRKIAENGFRNAAKEICHIEYQPELLYDVQKFHQTIMMKQTVARPEKEIELIKSGYEKAFRYEATYKGCAQSTLAALYETIGKENAELFRSADMLSCGCGRFGDGPCGGYSAGLLYLGQYAGRRLNHMEEDNKEQEKARELAEKLHNRYEECYDSMVCNDLQWSIFGQAFDLKNDKECKKFEEAGAFKQDKCPVAVGQAVKWVIEILLDEGYIKGDA